MPRSRSFLSRRALAVGAVAVTAALAAGCGGSAGSTTKDNVGAAAHQAAQPKALGNSDMCGKNTRTIKHDLGTTVIKGTPKRIVALEYSFVDALVNAGDKPVGVTDDGKPSRILKPLRDAIGHYTSVGLRQSPNLQVIKSLKPDLIIADSSRHAALYSQLTKIAPTIEIPSNAAGYDQIIAGEKLISQAVNACDTMNAALAKHAQVMAGLKAQVPASAKGRKVLFAVTSDKGFSTQTQLSFAPQVLRALGLTTVPETKAKDAIVSMTLETLVTTAPDVMFLARNTPKTLNDGWASNGLWKNLPAVKDKATFTVDGDVWSKSRGTLAAELLAREAIQKLSGTS